MRKIGHKKSCYNLEGELLDIIEVKLLLSNRDPYD